MHASEQFPASLQVLGGYLHQDFADDYSSADEALQASLAESGQDRLVAAASELELILAMSDNELEATVHQLCDYYPPADGLTWREWLQSVSRAVARARGDTAPQPD